MRCRARTYWAATPASIVSTGRVIGNLPMKTTPMSGADWRNPDAYEELRSLDAPGFAWEYLRRNSEFQQHREPQFDSMGGTRPAKRDRPDEPTG
jgi:hypothetical protein